jgi:hypothetical protein
MGVHLLIQLDIKNIPALVVVAMSFLAQRLKTLLNLKIDIQISLLELSLILIIPSDQFFVHPLEFVLPRTFLQVLENLMRVRL